MKSHFLLSGSAAMACAITGATGLITETADAQTFTAADYSTNSAYADGWQASDNGGFGFTAWSFDGTYTNAVQHAMYGTNSYNQLGLAWTLFLPDGNEPVSGTYNSPPDPPNRKGTDLSRAGRGFPPLQPGQTITTVFASPAERRFYGGYTIRLISGGKNIGYCCCGAVARLSVGTFDYTDSYFAPGRWFAGAIGDTGIYDTDTVSGASLAVTLTGPNNYKMVLTPLSNPGLAFTNSGTLDGGGPIDWIMFEHYNTDSDFFNVNPSGVTYTNVVSPAKATDFYIRSITIGDIQPLSPEIVQPPPSEAFYPGQTARLYVDAKGGSLSYRWRKNGADLANGGNISGAQSDMLIINNVGAADVAGYTVVVTNSLGAVTSTPPASLTVVQPGGAPYETAVLAAHPVAYWRLNDTGDPLTNAPAFDYVGGRVGTYGTNAQNGFNNMAGPGPPDFPGLESNNKALQSTADTDQSWVTIPALNLNTNAMTFALWVFPNSDPPDNAGVIYTRRGSTEAAGVNFTLNGQIGYTVNNEESTYDYSSHLVAPDNQWSFVAVVIQPTNAIFYLYNTNGSASATNDYAPPSYIPPCPKVIWDGIGFIGADADHSLDRTFDGKIDEVAVFSYAFTPQQVLALYNAAVRVTLSIQKVGANIVLTWPKGTLLEATNLVGPWVTNNATSPYTNSPLGFKKFYRTVQ